MANITPLAPGVAGISGAGAAFVASAVSGDQIVYTGGDLVLEFNNGHASPITVNIAPTKTEGLVPGAGKVVIPTRTMVIANGAVALMRLKADELKAYINAQGRIPLTYTGGNAALLLRAIVS